MSCNIDKDSHQKMVQDIGALALTSLHYHHASTKIRKTDSHNPQQRHYAQAPELEARRDYILTAQTILRLLPQIEKMPLRDMQKKAGWVAKEKAIRHEQGVKAFIKQPHRTKIQTQQLTESLNCPENQLLLWITDTVYERLSKIQQEYGSVFFESQMPENTPNQQINTLCNELKTAQNSRLFNEVSRIYNPPLPTERMLGSLGYGEIYHIFQQKVLRNTSIYTLKLALSKIKTIENLPIHKDYKIYEIWCFIQLYFAFVRYANFEPTQNILDLLEISTENNLLFKEGCCLTLKRGEISIKLFYEKKIEYANNKVKPDFLIELYYPNNTKPLAFVFDAKWRKYQEMPHDEEKCNNEDKKGYKCISCDAYTVAYKKYWLNINNHPNYQLLSSFILHSDNEKIENHLRYEHWNGFNFFHWLSKFEVYKSIDIKESIIRNHSVGAIMLRPDETLNNALSRLVYLILLYHLGNVWPEADNLCPQCGKKTIQQKGHHHCNSCNLQWTVRQCSKNNKHRIIDMGDTHKTLHVIETNNKEMKCPSCEEKAVR